MGVLPGYLLFFICLFSPPVLIYHSAHVTGWRKAAWVIGCFLSAFPPLLPAAAWLAYTVEYGGHERTAHALVFGPEASARAMANPGMLVMPRISYVVFRIRCANHQP